MANDRTLLVTGASGHLGRRVLDLLLAAGTRSIIATTRYPDRLGDFARRGVVVRFADFDNPESLPPAFAGAHRMLLVSTNATDGADRRQREHLAAISAAEQAGVEHLVYTSMARADTSRLSSAADHLATERRLVAGSVEYTILRENLFTEMLLSVLPYSITHGVLPSLPGDGGAAYISRDDCAYAASRALISCSGRQTFELTGPEVIRRAVLARLTANVTGRDVSYVALPSQELVRRHEAAGLPASSLLPIEQAIADGEFAFTTTDFFRLTGRQPAEVHDYLAAHRHALVKAA
ncbi:MAG TPA: NAD(P)H-binding protein [Labilithrix sp.]|jgi:NAD(P)H dehydrogenase (quinone)|nr:NAD(P)H-binding protein [Labilithrix sp.]